MKLVLIQHNNPTIKNYHGFTVQQGMYYGIVHTPFGKIPAAWSGWTISGSIALYTKLNGEWNMRFCDEEEIDAWNIISHENFEELEMQQGLPFFVSNR